MLEGHEAVRAVMGVLVEEASRVGKEERIRLGRELTEGEAGRLAEMVERQFRTALAIKQQEARIANRNKDFYLSGSRLR